MGRHWQRFVFMSVKVLVEWGHDLADMYLLGMLMEVYRLDMIITIFNFMSLEALSLLDVLKEKRQIKFRKKNKLNGCPCI